MPPIFCYAAPDLSLLFPAFLLIPLFSLFIPCSLYVFAMLFFTRTTLLPGKNQAGVAYFKEAETEPT